MIILFDLPNKCLHYLTNAFANASRSMRGLLLDEIDYRFVFRNHLILRVTIVITIVERNALSITLSIYLARFQ